MVKNAALAFTAWPTLTQDVSRPRSFPGPPAGHPEDEPFWTGIRSQFELRNDQIILGTAVRGVMTRATREKVAESTEQFNSFRETGVRELMTASRTKAAAFINAPVDSVVLLRNTTEGVDRVAEAFEAAAAAK
jgi:selenocysteine lyase/cysteine desulfurase